MDLNFLTIYIILVLAAICPNQLGVNGREQKGPGVRHLCGQNFINTWRLLCQIKQLKSGRGRKKRSLDESGVVKLKGVHDLLLDSKTAKQFLTASVRTRRSLQTLNASEECCVEGCSLSEVAEYDC